jgi:hypothetical protein
MSTARAAAGGHLNGLRVNALRTSKRKNWGLNSWRRATAAGTVSSSNYKKHRSAETAAHLCVSAALREADL